MTVPALGPACLLVGDLPPGGLPGLFDSVHRLPFPFDFLQPGGRVQIENLLDLAERAVSPGRKPASRPVVVVASHPLTTREGSTLYGFSDRRRQLAVVSTAGLATVTRGRGGRGEVLLRSRLHNLVAHEIGHLRGLAHCTTPGCLMSAVRDPDEMDRRSLHPCGECPPMRWWTPWKEALQCGARGSGRLAHARKP